VLYELLVGRRQDFEGVDEDRRLHRYCPIATHQRRVDRDRVWRRIGTHDVLRRA
jgi:hypothetical protein